MPSMQETSAIHPAEDKKSVKSLCTSETMQPVVREVKQSGIPPSWTVGTDYLAIQSQYSLKQKGYLRKVEWKESAITGAGCGAFAAEFISKGALIRRGRKDENLLLFETKDDLPPLTETTLQYLTFYLAGPPGSCGSFIPGSSFNHNGAGSANTSLSSPCKDEWHVVATQDICAGEELLEDYRRFGKPPVWLQDIAQKYNVPFVYQGMNDFV